MTVISSGTWPIDATATSGTELVTSLNELVNAVQSTQVSDTRPPALQKGGIWAKTLGAADIALMFYDGTADHEVGSVISGNVSFGGVVASGTAPTAPAAGDTWVDTSVVGAPVLKVYTGTAWGASGLQGVNNLSDVTSASAARANIGANSASNLTTGTLNAARINQLTQSEATDSGNTAMGLVSGQRLAQAVAANASSGGMDLLGTVNTTSGSAQSLTGLNLTSYNFLKISIDNVSGNSAVEIKINGSSVNASSSNDFTGFFDVSLDTGFHNAMGDSVKIHGQNATGLSRSSTSITFSLAVGVFNSGQIKVYGVK